MYLSETEHKETRALSRLCLLHIEVQHDYARSGTSMKGQ
jgi:hypothetical protein